MKQVTITNLNGSEPYSIYICNASFNNCMYYAQINNSDIPFTFLVPSTYQSLNSVGVLAIDLNGCEIKNTVTF